MLEAAKLVLEYLKVLLDFPFLSLTFAVFFVLLFRNGITALLLRVGTIRFPWGEVTTRGNIQTPERVTEIESEVRSASVEEIISDLTQEKQQEIQQLANSYIEYARLWEFRYLNLFLAQITQRVLDWFIACNGPIPSHLYDSTWLPVIPSANDRASIFSALQAHHLIHLDSNSGLITVTPKGQRYQEWRGGPLPPPESPTGTSAGTA